MDAGHEESHRFFSVWVVFAQVIGLTVVVMVSVWMGHYQGGFAWTSDPSKQFNYHPLFMVIGMVFLYGNAILVYRVFRNERKIYIKTLHASLLLLAAIFAIVGLKAVFDSHNLASPPVPNLFSLHSWIGLGAVILFGLQWVIGFITFLFPGLAVSFRSFYMPYHRFWGVCIFILACAAALTGITEKAIFSVKDYNKKLAETFVVNLLGIGIAVFGIIITYTATNSHYRRQQLPDDERIPLKD